MLPDVIVIGAMKCATTSLHYYLSLHPAIAMAPRSGVNFFVAEENWSRGLGWYEGQFQGEAEVYGEVSPAYTNYPLVLGVPERMHEVVPAAKLVYSVRDPIQRIVAHWRHDYSLGFTKKNFDEAVCETAYLDRSRYWLQLQQFLAFYPQDRILVVCQEELLLERRRALAEIFRFLGVDDSFSDLRFRVRRHRTDDKRLLTALGKKVAGARSLALLGRVSPDLEWHAGRILTFPLSRAVPRPEIPRSLETRLRLRLQDDVDRLRAFTGREFSQWAL